MPNVSGFIGRIFCTESGRLLCQSLKMSNDPSAQPMPNPIDGTLRKRLAVSSTATAVFFWSWSAAFLRSESPGVAIGIFRVESGAFKVAGAMAESFACNAADFLSVSAGAAATEDEGLTLRESWSAQYACAVRTKA